MKIRNLLSERVKVFRKLRVSDGVGGWALKYPKKVTPPSYTDSIGEANPIHSGLRSRRTPASSREVEFAARQGAEVTDVFYFEPSVALQRGDTVVDSRGRVYALTLPQEPSEPGYVKWQAVRDASIGYYVLPPETITLPEEPGEGEDGGGGD